MAGGRLINRRAELERLKGTYEAAAGGEPQLVVTWGRRRVGKTFLLSHFVQDKRAVFHAATQQAEGVELRRLHDEIHRELGPATADLTGGGFSNWEAALRFLSALARDEPLVVVLDEIPYLADTTDGFPSIVQAVWDHVQPGTKLLLVLTGSAVGFIDRILGADGALHGRPTMPMRLDSLSLWQARQFLTQLEPGAFLEAYAACGGYPLHLREWDQGLDTNENLRRLAGTPGAVLLEDAAGMLREELPEAGGYQRVMAAVGRGRTRFGEIADEAARGPVGPVAEAVSDLQHVLPRGLAHQLGHGEHPRHGRGGHLRLACYMADGRRHAPASSSRHPARCDHTHATRCTTMSRVCSGTETASSGRTCPSDRAVIRQTVQSWATV